MKLCFLNFVLTSRYICIIYTGHEVQPHQPAVDEYRGGGHADHGGVHPLQCAHVHHGGQIRDLGAESTDTYCTFIRG